MYYYVKVANANGRMAEGIVKADHDTDFTTDECLDMVLQSLGIYYNDDTLADWWIDEWEEYTDEEEEDEEEEEEEYTWWDAHEDEYMEEHFNRKYSRV